MPGDKITFPDDVTSQIRRFMHLETSAGRLLVLATVLAMLVKNSDYSDAYSSFLSLEGQVRIGSMNIEKALFLWVNDGWMAIFFFLVGLEIKREVLHGHLRDRRQMILPAIGALGGVLVPALIYAALNWHDPVGLKGWARLPAEVGSRALLGVALLCGVGFTMSLFIGGLAFAEGGSGYARIDRLGIIIGSLVSAVAGFAVLRSCPPIQNSSST